MVDLMGLLSDALIGSFQMLMLNDLGKNMFPYRIKTCWKRILIYGVTALVILGVNHIESTFINIMMVPVSYTIAAIVIFQGSVWKKIILACCYYMLAIVPEFLFAVITGAYGVTGTENNFHSELEKLLSLLLMSTITFLLVKCVNQITRKKNYQTIENKLFTVLLTLPAATIIIFMCIYYSHISFTGVNRIMIPIGAALLLMTNLLKIRTTNSHRVFDIEKGHVAALEVTIINNKEYVIHFDIDLLVADLKSIGIVLNDLAALYGDKYLPELPNNINFMNRVVNTNQSDYVKDREYWNQKMDDIPGMPELPICKKIIQIKKPVFKRRNFFLDENKWKYLLEICAFRQVTPAMVLLSLYAEVLGKFSNSSRFLINVPLFGRPLDEENIDFVVGDFTNILLLPIDISGKNQFIDQVNNITDIFMEAMKHTSYSGVEVIRDLLKKDTGNKLIAPVVFSCNYDEVMVPVLFEKKLGKLDYISTQTPQVLIDFQILKMTEGILFSWDVVDEAFCEGTIDTMFDCYMKALEDLIEQPDSWNKKIEFMELSSFPERYENIATLGKTNGYIHDKVFENMEKKSNNIAVLETDTHKSITYQELKIKVENLMCILIEFGVHKGDKVGIYLPKGSNQIVAVMFLFCLVAVFLE